MNNSNRHKEMLFEVATALGPELCQQLAFVGGCTTALFLTDEFSLEQVRHTDDVDVIANLMGKAAFGQLQARLRKLGFKDSTIEGDPICAMRWGALRVDFMPDDEEILGFSNRWYKDAFSTANNIKLSDAVSIRLVTPVYFVATKLEAYLGRGLGDPLGSRDIEDLLSIFDGRPILLSEIKQADLMVRKFITLQIKQLLGSDQFAYAVQSSSLNDSGREELLFKRLEQVAQITTTGS